MPDQGCFQKQIYLTWTISVWHCVRDYSTLLPRRYMKYLYAYECEKKALSSPAELQAAIDGNRREGRRPSYSSSLFGYSPAAAAAAAAAAALAGWRRTSTVGLLNHGAASPPGPPRRKGKESQMSKQETPAGCHPGKGKGRHRLHTSVKQDLDSGQPSKPSRPRAAKIRQN